MPKFTVPEAIKPYVTQATYTKWLNRKAITHLKRDRARGNASVTGEAYKAAIHQAVIDCGIADPYTGEKLDWSLIGRYDNGMSKSEGRVYKKTLALLPTVDHVGDGLGSADFKICTWRTNDAKHDLSYEEFLELCQRVVAHSKNTE